MARKKKSKSAPKRRRRVGAGPSGGIAQAAINIALGVGGAVAGAIITKSVFPTMDSKTKGLIGVAAGALGVSMVKNPMIKSVSLGLGIGSGYTLLQGMGVVGAVPYRRLNGPGINRMVNGAGEGITRRVNGPGEGIARRVNGVPSDMDAYAVASMA